MKGNIELLNCKCVCVSGNEVKALDIERMQEFVPKITEHYTLVSTSFKGVDEEVNKLSIKPILYILPNGIDNPSMHSEFREIDLLISEYPPEAHATKDTFRNRNRLVACFADILILISSLKNGPINNLVTNFLNHGKEIYCFPGDGSIEDGNSELIKQGANLITSIQDVI